MAHGKKYNDAVKRYDDQGLHGASEAVDLVKRLASAKFDETVELAVRLGVDPRKAEQMLRGTVALPSGTGTDVRVAVFAAGEQAQAARDAGADLVGADELIAQVEGGMLDFDVAIATPDLMPQVGKLGRVLGPRGLMPNPKTGTVTPDVGKAVGDFKGGKVEYRTDRHGNVHVPIGKVSFEAPALGRQPPCRPRGARAGQAGQRQGPLLQAHHHGVHHGPRHRRRPQPHVRDGRRGLIPAASGLGATTPGRYPHRSGPRATQSNRCRSPKTSGAPAGAERVPPRQGTRLTRRTPPKLSGAFACSERPWAVFRPPTATEREEVRMENPRPEKVAVVDEVRERFNDSDAAVLTEYRGINVGDMSELRRALRAAGGDYKIYKNTLVRFATNELGLELDEMLTGPTAIAFVPRDGDGDPVMVAKALRDFAKGNPNLVMKGGVLGGRILTQDEIKALAEVAPARSCSPSWLA